jgi:hypothetical protein
MAEIRNDVAVSEYSVSNVALQETPVLINASTAITHNDYGNRLIMVPDFSSAITVTLERPRAAGIRNRVTYIGRNATGANLTLDGNGSLMTGSVHHIGGNSGLNTGARFLAAHDALQVATGATQVDLELVSGDDLWYVSGKVVSTAAVTGTNV